MRCLRLHLLLAMLSCAMSLMAPVYSPPIAARKYPRQPLLRMHRDHGHSHDHSHGSHEVEIKKPSSKTNMNFRSLSLFGRAVEILKVPILRGSIAAVLLLAPLLIRRKMNSNYSTIAVIASIVLTVFDDLKHQTKIWMNKIKVFQSSLLKHTSPITKEYFFKNSNAADRVTILGVWVNIALSVVKFFGGLYFRSAVLVADAGHSLSDLFSDFITLWAVQIARLPPDDDHPYGHGKFESIGSLFLSFTLLLTGVGVAGWSYERMQAVVHAQMGSSNLLAEISPSWQASALALASIVSKEWLFRVTKRVGEALNSQVVLANAWHHRSDAFSSVLSLASIALAILFPKLLIADSACGIFIAGMIMLTGIEILVESIRQLSDTQNEEVISLVEEAGRSVDGVLGVQRVRARSVGNGNLVDLTILTDGKISASAANLLAERVRWAVLGKVPDVIDALVRTQSSSVVCPLLVAGTKSITEVESHVRAALSSMAEVETVERVTVNMLDLGGVGVEAVVRSKIDSLDALKRVASALRDSLKSQDIDVVQADVLLAL